MSKLKLQVDELCVESFETADDGAARGTVHGHFTNGAASGCFTCNFSACVETCPDTCDNSLDYCTCACTADCTNVGPGCHHISDAGSCPCYH